MSSTTPNLNLTLCDAGQEDWDVPINAGLTAIDTAHGNLSAFSKINTATMTAPAVPVIDLSKGRILYFPLTVSATSVTLQNQGALTDGEITVMVQQPAGGACAFVLPSLFQGGGDLSSSSGNLTGSTVSIQKFLYSSALGKAYAITPLSTVAK